MKALGIQAKTHWALACWHQTTGQKLPRIHCCEWTRINQKEASERDSQAWNIYVNSNKGYWLKLHLEHACSRASGHEPLSHKLDKVGGASCGGLLGSNQSPSVGLPLPLCATVAPGKVKIRNGGLGVVEGDGKRFTHSPL